MGSSSIVPEPRSRASEADLDRVCWVCLDSGLSEEPNENWCRPCKCRGALKWVHHSCLQRWIDEQQSTRGQTSSVSCRACGAQYEIIYPPTSLLYIVLETIDSRTRVLSYYLAGGLVLGSFYWSAVTYGAVTVMQVLGHQQGLQQMERMDPLILLLTLPTIPVGLLLAKAVPWENCLRCIWRQYISRLGFIRWLTCKAWPRWPMREGAVEPGPEGYEFPRLLCSALALPTIAAMTGRLVFPRIRSDTHRLLLGGLTFLGIKGVLSVSYQEMRYMRTCHRMVKNYEGD